MKMLAMSGLLATTMLVTTVTFSTQSFAQDVSIEFVPEQRTYIREYVERERVPRAVVRERYRVGTIVPPDVELREVPGEWAPSARRYRYYHGEDGVHFVDPGSRRVIYDND